MQLIDTRPMLRTLSAALNSAMEKKTMPEDDMPLEENTIYRTHNFGGFTLDLLNRPLKSNKLAGMIDAVKQKNLLHLFPIIVSPEFVVIDGQHRLVVAKTLDLDIYYVVSRQMVIEDAALVSAHTDGWVLSDYQHHWCRLGLTQYLRLRAFHEAHPWLSLSHAAKLCYRGTQGTATTKNSIHVLFEHGDYQANNVEQAERVCKMANDFSKWIPFWNQSAFIAALRNLDTNADYDHTRMMNKMQSQSAKLVKCSTAEIYIDVMNNIYNYRMSDDKKVHLRKIGASSSKWREQSKSDSPATDLF